MNPTLTRALSLTLAIGAMGALLSYGITEEVPLTNVEGTLVMQENGKPLANALIELEPAVRGDEESPLRSRFVETDKDGLFRIGTVAAGNYTVQVSTNAHAVKRFYLELREGKAKKLDLKATPVDPFLDLYGSAHVFTPSETAKFELKGFFKTKTDSLKFKAFKLDFQKVVAEGSLYNALAPLSRSGNNVTDPTKMGSVYKDWEQPITNVDAEGVFMEKLTADKFEEGLYWIQVTAPGQKVVQGTWMNVTKIALVGKQVNGQNVSYVTDIMTGDPIPGAEIGIGTGGDYKQLGVTNSEGILRSELPREGRRVLVAGSGASRALVDYYRNEQSADGIRIVTYPDRTIYRPGDTIQFKGIIRKLTGNAFSIPPAGPVKLELLDETDNVVGEAKTTISPMGTYDGQFVINKESEPGYFAVRSTYGEAESRMGFSVAAYRKPTYTVTVTPEKSSYIRGDRARFKVKAEYYFGGPVPNAKVEGYVYRDIDWWGGEEGEGEYNGPTGTYGDFSQSIETTTNADGEAIIEFETRVEGDQDAVDYDFRYSVNVSVADEGGKYFDGQGSVRVTRGDIDLKIESPVYISAPNTPVTFDVTAQSTGASLAGRKVEIDAGIELWDGKGMQVLRPEKQTVTLDASGKATLTLTPTRGGSYNVHGKIVDSRGNVVGASSYLWIDGVIDGNPGPFPKLTVKMDKKEYKAGDVAKAMIQTDRTGGTALVTLESDRIYLVRTVKLAKNVETFEVPILDEYTPNVEINVTYIKDKQFSQASHSVDLTLGHRELKIEVTPDRERYNPGETATFSVKTSTDAGMPVPAEVSLGVVDESIYALSEDTFNLAEQLYPTKYNSIETQYSFPELYLDGGDKAPTSIQVRRVFKDTAFWAPKVMTDANGMATIQVPLPDNLTTWRATARGITSRTEAGQMVGKVMANKDLMVRLEGPSFMVNGDEQVVKAVVTNRTGSDAQVRVQLEAENLSVEGSLQQQVSVKANANGAVEVRVKPGKSGEAKLVAKAWIDGGATDGVEQKFEVRARGVLLNDRFAGDTKTNGQFKVTLQDGADIDTGRLKVTVAPTIAWTMVQSLDYLIDFPYGCVEQTMSRFYPAVAVSGAVESLGVGRPRRADQIPAIVADGVTRLRAMQNSSGAWGWWNYDEGDPAITAYVLEGLLRAKQAGYRVPENMTKRALEWSDKLLKAPIKTPEWAVTPAEKSHFWESETADRVYLASVTVQWGAKDSAVAFLKTVKLDKATAVTAGHLALAAKALGQDPKPAIAKLASLARVSGAIATWDEQYWGVETTARSLKALAIVEPTHPLIPKVLRYLLEKKRGDSWFSTRDTAFALVAMTQYLKNTKELANLDGEVTLRVNGQDMGRVTFSQVGLSGPPTEFTIPLSQLKKGENTVELVRSTGGIVYYAVDMRQTVPTSSASASAPGLTITRTYHKLSSKRLQDGTMRFGADTNATVSADAGDLIEVQIVIDSDKRRDFILVEDPIPASCRITDREDLPQGETWSWWWSKSSFFDDRAAFFTRNLPAGKSTITYTMRAEMAGKSTALPTVIYNMYDPDQRSVAPEITMEVAGG